MSGDLRPRSVLSVRVLGHRVLPLALSLASSARLAAVPDPARVFPSWAAHKTKHFVVLYSGEDALARQVGLEAERHYVRIARDLGYTRYGNFWLWDDRATIRLYPSHSTYVRVTGAPAWSAGKANFARRDIETFVGSKAFLSRILPHELTHLVFRDFVGFEGEVPLWLDEGVAQWQETRAAGSPVHRLARQMQRSGDLLSVDQLTRLDVRQAVSAGRARQFYVQAASLVAFVIDAYGTSGFQKLCTQLRDGKNLETALRFTYPRTIRTIEILNGAWQEHLESIE